MRGVVWFSWVRASGVHCDNDEWCVTLGCWERTQGGQQAGVLPQPRCCVSDSTLRCLCHIFLSSLPLYHPASCAFLKRHKSTLILYCIDSHWKWWNWCRMKLVFAVCIESLENPLFTVFCCLHFLVCTTATCQYRKILDWKPGLRNVLLIQC